MNKDMLKEVLAAYGPTGREDQVSRVIRRHVEPKADRVWRDALGNLIAYRKGTSGKKVMLSAHMDQIGLIVTDIDEDGFLRVANVGGVNPTITIARAVILENGVRGVTYFETEKKNATNAGFGEMFVDIGASSREEAQGQAAIGDIAVYASDFVEMGSRVSSGALDDRLCCALMIEAFLAAETEHDIYAAFLVQEEVGLRGAGPAAYAIEPDFNINSDVTPAGDTPKAARLSVGLGKGPAIKVMDRSVIVPVCVRDFMVDCARSNSIPYQMEVLNAGGTDTGAIQRSRAGVLAGCVSLPTRYVHSPVETADAGDYDNALKLILAMLERKELPSI